MSILNFLLDENKWLEYLNYKISQSNLSKLDLDVLNNFIKNKDYLEISQGIVQGNYIFSLPEKKLINKSGSTKKRVIYSFNFAENIILKFITFWLDKYDSYFSKNCFSFRKNISVKNAFFSILNHKNLNNMYCYKVDISNYFNSIDIETLLPILENILSDDKLLFNMFKDLLVVDKCIFEGKVISEKRGAMAGISLSTFLANVYLMELDKYFSDNGIIYARYSDDIIVFAEDLETLGNYKNYISDFILKMKLVINKDKEFIFKPNEAWNFLGFEYQNGKIDLSKVTLKKTKDKIRRKARAIYRWKISKNKTTEHAIKVMIRVYNNKFYRETNLKQLSWIKWFFPIINTHKSLKVIDEYLVSYLRYLSSGKFSKKNFNITYEFLKSCGYRSLVNEYYKNKEN